MGSLEGVQFLWFRDWLAVSVIRGCVVGLVRGTLGNEYFIYECFSLFELSRRLWQLQRCFIVSTIAEGWDRAFFWFSVRLV